MKKNNLIGIILAGAILCSFTGLTHSVNLSSHKNKVIKNTVLLTAPATSTNSNPGKWILTNGHYYYQSSTSNTNETGWQQINNYWYYFNTNGIMQTGWISQNGKSYYLNGAGIMQTDWTHIGNYWYYFNDGGAMQTGWITQNGQSYYLNDTGIMQTSWTHIGNSLYYFNTHGMMQTGWVTLNGESYYLNNSGIMQTGWIQFKDNWYYLNNNGLMQTGWTLINNYWYYMNNYGMMQTGWINQHGQFYYLNGAGIMQTGWIYLNNNWYYFNKKGLMETNTTIDGYKINANGIATKTSAVTGQQIVNYAEQFLGKPYVWGATGPNAFDCSGLTYYVYKHFGYNIGCTTYTQVDEGTPVSLNNLEPGDLIFWGPASAPYHVAIYIGNRQYIQAPKPGENVDISSWNLDNISAAVRIL